MNNHDQHLGTGIYNPEKYWSARALHRHNDYLRAVCTFAGTNMENRSADRVQWHFMQAALKQLQVSEKKVLEYGCGVGRWVNFFQTQGYDWSGVDISGEMLTLAAQRFPKVKLEKVRDGYRLPFPDQSFDLIYSVTVLHHNDYRQQEKIISEMARVLKNSGSLILLEDLGGRSAFNMFARNKDSWLGMVESYHLKNTWYQEICYWILRDLLGKWQSRPALWSVWRRCIGFWDFLLDPHLYFLRRNKSHNAAIMIFAKQATAQYQHE